MNFKTCLLIFQINTKVTSLNLKGNDLSKDGVRYVTRMMAENDSISELVSIYFSVPFSGCLSHNNI